MSDFFYGSAISSLNNVSEISRPRVMYSGFYSVNNSVEFFIVGDR